MKLETELLHADGDGFVIMKTFSFWKRWFGWLLVCCFGFFFFNIPEWKILFSCVDQARPRLCRYTHPPVKDWGAVSICSMLGMRQNSCTDKYKAKLCASTDENIKERRRRNWSLAMKFGWSQPRAMCQLTSQSDKRQERAAFSRTNVNRVWLEYTS